MEYQGSFKRQTLRDQVHNCLSHLKTLLRPGGPKPPEESYLGLTGRHAITEFEHLVAEAVSTLGQGGTAYHNRVEEWLTDKWFAHLYHPYYYWDDEYTWARIWVARSEVKRKLAKLEGDFIVTSCILPGEDRDAH